jgi:DnaJ-class molecular chaperone
MFASIYQVCPKCGGSRSYDRAEDIVSPCGICNGQGIIKTSMSIDITDIMDELGKIKGKIK